MERTRGFRGSEGWSIMDYSIQVQYTWVVSSFSIHREGQIFHYLGAFSINSLVGKIEVVEEHLVLFG
jgi:hypothetical protein